ncbi:carbon catabolite repressor protein 4 homolog 3 isoform X2 [Carica papaya]|uniref:carbon catabolite repressor protein 4 homolog 3 isoform X2 n=1 Tax=Carica papaya TaxID=3649 RepID=UPI000B8CF48E|nr:carbon catabolite repressor protein 4 homolog 3 isoform X2 [Carica papaya]
MGFDACSWPRPRLPVATTTSSYCSLKLERFFFFVFCKHTKSTSISCSVSEPSNSPASSSTRSYSRRWYNPLRNRPSDSPTPYIVRHWIDSDCPLASQERFTVVSYNILGDRNAWKHNDLYPNVPFHYMEWGHRRRVICQELSEWEPDIICMQEVDRYFDLLSLMEEVGYVGSYKRRTGDYADGCATFWKADKFCLVEGESIEFKGLGLRDNVAQLSVLEMMKVKSRRVLIGNIHVIYNPNRGDVKLGQVRLLSSKAEILSKKWGNIPIVLAGDFNSTPQSAIYKFLTSSELNIMLHDRRELSGQRRCHPAQVFGAKREMESPLILIDSLFKDSWTREEAKAATGSAESDLAVHPLKLNSSYATIKGSTRTRDSNGEPLATSYHSKFLGTVDYLWYSGDVIPTKVLDTVPIDTLSRTGGLPSEKLGSDHLALVSEFAFVQGMRSYDN